MIDCPLFPGRTRDAVRAAAVFVFVQLLAGCAAPPSDSLVAPPPTRTDDAVETLHGVEIPDPYRWLEDQESPETRAWIDAQNAHTDTVLGLAPARRALATRFEALMKIDQVGSPQAAGDRYFFVKRRADQDLQVLYFRQGVDGDDEVLIDPHGLAEDHSKSVVKQDVSADGALLAYGIREGGRDEVSIHLYDVDTRSDLGEELPEARYQGVSVAPDRATLYYSRLTAEGPRIFRHAVGADPATDPVIFGEGQDRGRILAATLSDDGRHLLVHVFHGSAAERIDIYLADLAGVGTFQPVVEGLDASFFAAFAGDALVIRTTLEAPNGRIVRVPLDDARFEHRREIVATRDSAVLRSVSAVGGKLFASYLENVRSRIVAFDLEGAELGEIAMDEIGSVSNVSGAWDETEAFFSFSSFHVPPTIYRYDTGTGERTVWSERRVPVRSAEFVVEQVRYPSKDGTEIPMFVLRRHDAAKDGSRPTYLTGYGGFNVSRTPRWSASAVAWVERGGVFAVANLRGGGELGEAWHQMGMRENKQNVFDDFIAAAEHLIAAGWTRPEKLAIRGGSNGGLLVAAVANQRPDLFGAVICSYPLLDMIRYHRFMVARYWVPEYGSSEDPDLFGVLRAYSPYHNVEAGGRYPAMLFVTGDGDTRVAPLHARKMAALVQARNQSERPILLRYHTKAGHSGGRPVSQEIADNAEAFAFLLWQLGEAPA